MPKVKHFSSEDKIKYVIKKGSHYSYVKLDKGSGYKRKFLSKLLPLKSIRGVFKTFRTSLVIPASSWYSLPDSKDSDWQDLNKLIGVNFHPLSVHKSSFRLAWKPDFEEEGSIEIYLYIYTDGKRIHDYNSICKVKTNEIVDITLSSTHWNTFYVSIDQEGKELVNKEIDFFRPRKHNYFSILDPYFGGDKKALKDIKVLLDGFEFDYY